MNMTEYQIKQAQMLQSIEDSFRNGEAPSTLVKMSNTFQTDQDHCLSNVVFVPELADHQNLRQLLTELKKVDLGQYFYPVESLHTTIKNVRTVHIPALFTEGDIEKISPVLREVASRYAPFEITWKGLLLLPTSVAVKGVSSEVFSEFVRELHQGLIDIGVPDNKKYASLDVFAHISTFCRYTHAPSSEWNEVLARFKDVEFGSRVVDSFSLVDCNAVAASGHTRIIETFSLGR